MTYTVRIDFAATEWVNWMDDDQYHGFNPAQHCEVFDDNDTSQGAPQLPTTFYINWYIICEYSYELGAASRGSEHVNVFTVSVGLSIRTAAIELGDVPGTYDISDEAVVTFIAAPSTPAPLPPERTPPPNIGGGLSGLFAGQPTALPSSVAPAVGGPSTIRPPSTGEAGLR